MSENNRAARAARTLVEFFDVVCHITTWHFQIHGFNDNVKTERQIFRSLNSILWRSYQSTGSVIFQQCRMHVKSNNCKIVTIAQVFLSKWRFIWRSRRGCWSSPIPICDLSCENLHWWLSMKRVIHKAHPRVFSTTEFLFQLIFCYNLMPINLCTLSFSLNYIICIVLVFQLQRALVTILRLPRTF